MKLHVPLTIIPALLGVLSASTSVSAESGAETEPSTPAETGGGALSEPAAAIDAAASDAAPDTGDAEPESPYAVGLSFLVSSIYNYRGLNVFKEHRQTDQHMLFSPSITGTVIHPGLWLQYAGYFQINGDNRDYLVDSGAGAKQTIAVGFDYDITPKLTLATSLTYLCFPFALSRIVGVDLPSYLEPAVGIQYRTDRNARLGLQLSYFAPIQQRLRDQRYMYTHLSVGRAFPFSGRLALDLDLSLGYKLFADPSTWQDTIFDLEFCVALPVALAERLQLVPAGHMAWGYLSGTSFGDQYMIYFSIELRADFLRTLPAKKRQDNDKH